MLMYAVAIVDIGLLVMGCWEYSIYVQMREQLMFFVIVHTSLVYLTASLLECCPVQVVCLQIIVKTTVKHASGEEVNSLDHRSLGDMNSISPISSIVTGIRLGHYTMLWLGSLIIIKIIIL